MLDANRSLGSGAGVSARVDDWPAGEWQPYTSFGKVMSTAPTNIESGEVPLVPDVDAGLSEGIAVHKQRVYWTARTSTTEATGAVFRISTGGGAVQTIATGRTNPSALAVDASGVYWTNRTPTGGAVMRASLSGGDPATIATDQAGPYGIALDALTVYWTNADGGHVMKVAK